MPQSIPAGLQKEHILKTLADLDAGIDHPFGIATGYELDHDGKRYAPKAVIGLACRFSIGRILQPEAFSGGEAPGQANFVLRKLGFTVVRKGEEQEEPQTGKEWSANEVSLIVADYFDMLEAELLDKSYQKSEHRKALVPQLAGRSEGSVEFKHQNISAVLVEHGLPYIEGYKPRGNYQSLLASEVDLFLDQHPGLLQKIASAPLLNPVDSKKIITPDFNKVIVAPPEKMVPPKSSEKPWLSRRARKIDFAERDARNRQLGSLAEQFVYDLERYRLQLAGRDDLAQKVVWASKDIGDGLGFDILSFDDADDSERMLEVKATGLGKFFPFYVTANELRCSEDIPEQFNLFRVFDFGRTPRLYILHGALSQLCQLDPVLYRAVI
ncbi:DUF3883 domain-containing protein [Rhodopirellula sallentina]|uniref:Uncharacterized protein n=1 Tax=Rhodopirellula sallentina SM41 TaxID=1263870 RepID=M5U1T8_9BACT|nr:DUF3883 domain-containing protein [Rhodopirellula sallentina]EMI55224.1 hypothetical protein RSSM_03361 [Rhodopirellula sallentina SM41]